jgi:predicted nucleotidyltransferase
MSAKSPPPSIVERLTRCLTARPEILDAYLFGSHARGDAARHSDIDVAVYVDPDRVPRSNFGYAAELTSELGTALGSDAVDVVVLNQAPPLLYHRVLRDGVRVLARNLAATTTREGQALSRFCDYVLHLRKIDAAHAARIEAGSFGR